MLFTYWKIKWTFSLIDWNYDKTWLHNSKLRHRTLKNMLSAKYCPKWILLWVKFGLFPTLNLDNNKVFLSFSWNHETNIKVKVLKWKSPFYSDWHALLCSTYKYFTPMSSIQENDTWNNYIFLYNFLKPH